MRLQKIDGANKRGLRNHEREGRNKVDHLGHYKCIIRMEKEFKGLFDYDFDTCFLFLKIRK